MNCNCRLNDFVTFSLKHTLETAHMYANQAKKCSYKEKKIFLYYLAGKKRVQYVQIELLSNTQKKCTDFNTMTFENIQSQQSTLASLSIPEIRDFAKQKAEKDLSLYHYLMILEEDCQTQKFLFSLSKLSKEYLRDISNGYALFKSQKGPFHPRHSFIAKTIQTKTEITNRG